MKKFLGIFISLALVVGMLFPLFEASVAQAVGEGDTAAVGVTIDSTISISTPGNVTVGEIVGTGTGVEGTATWTVITNDSAGYKLEWQASTAAMENGSDAIGAYTPAAADTPETWSVATTDSEWGARLKSASDDTAAEWGADTSSEMWLNIDATTREIVSLTQETDANGSAEIVAFKVEVGSSKHQPTGNYTVDVTVTTTTL